MNSTDMAKSVPGRIYIKKGMLPKDIGIKKIYLLRKLVALV